MRVASDDLESNHRLTKRRQAFDNDGFDDRKVSVVIVMHKDVAHSRNLVPRDFGRGAEDIGIDVLDRLTDLHQSGSACVKDNTVVQVTLGDVFVYRVNGIFDVG